jgi:hypothetical protein
VESRVEGDVLEYDEEADRDQAERANLGDNLLRVASSVVVLTNEGGSATKERVGTGGDDNALSLSLLASPIAIKTVRNCVRLWRLR